MEPGERPVYGREDVSVRDIGADGTNVPIREKAHSGISPAAAAKARHGEQA